MLISRRQVISAGLGMGFAGVAHRVFASEPLAVTALQPIGPFYPMERPVDQDADLTTLHSASGPARGQPIEIVGRVLDPAGRPVPQARIDLWQANAAGRYAHPLDDSDAPLDPNFQGSAVIKADGEGRYKFRTIRPGAYGRRTPHIHFDVSGRSQRIITQMYFPDEELNATDGILQNLRKAGMEQTAIAQAVSRPASVSQVPTYQWDIILAAG